LATGSFIDFSRQGCFRTLEKLSFPALAGLCFFPRLIMCCLVEFTATKCYPLCDFCVLVMSRVQLKMTMKPVAMKQMMTGTVTADHTKRNTVFLLKRNSCPNTLLATNHCNLVITDF